MSYISKLMILGVRAFPTERGETIKFESPLTLVAGINGSGKTTIIEALRFATTGSLPPGAGLKGAWIHDPGLEGEKEVLAQVRFMFHAANGTRLVATRNLQLTLKKATRTQKTKEASLLIERHGEKRTLSTRVAELDQQIPLYLGVSVSLLDNVLFCHQEDSQWPLAESGTLKKKFDEIFEAGKYTKAVKELLEIRKKHRADLGAQEEKEKSAEKDKTRAKKVRAQIEKLDADVEDLRKRAVDLLSKQNSSLAAANKAWEEGENLGPELNRLESHRIDAMSKEQSLNDLKVHLKEIDQTEDWLKNALSEFDTSMARHQDDRDSKREQYLEYEEQLQDVKHQLDAKLTEQGQYQQEKVAHKQNLERRKAQIKTSATRHQIRGFEDLSDATKVEDFCFKIKKMSKDRSSKLERARIEADEQKAEAITTVNKLTQRQLAMKDTRVSTSHQIAENNRQASQKQAEAVAINVDEGTKAGVETSMEDLQNRLAQLREEVKVANYASKIKNANVELSKFESDLGDLSDQQMQASKRAGEIAQLSHVKQQVKQRERSLTTLLQAHTDRINTLVGDQWTPSTLENKYKSVVSDAARDTATAERERDGVIRETEKVQYKLKTLREGIQTRKVQVANNEAIVKKAIDGDIAEYEEEATAAETRLNIARDHANNFTALVDYFQKVLVSAEEQHVCRVCERAFKGPQDQTLVKMQTKLRTVIQRTNAKAEEAALEEAIEDHKLINEVSVNYENWKRLTQDEIPPLEQSSLEMTKELEKLLTKTERHDQTVESVRAVQKELESISINVSSIVKTEHEIKELATKVEELTTKQSQHGHITTLEDLQEQMNAAKSKIQEARTTVARLTNDQNLAQSNSYSMELEFREFKNELEMVSRQLDRKTALLDRVQEFKDANQKQRASIEKLDADIEKLGPEIDTAKAKRDDVDQRANTQLKELADEARSLDESVNSLDMTNHSIQNYIDNDGEGRLAQTIRDVERVRRDIAQLEAARTQVMKQITKIEEHLKDGDNQRRHYADNLRFKQESNHLKWLNSEIDRLDAKNLEQDREMLLRKNQHFTKEHHSFVGQRAGVVGEAKQKDLQLQELMDEWKTDLKDAGKNFKLAHVKHQSTKAAIEDIGKYSTALDQAITKYHSLKMEQVNSIIDELWRATYMGTDIDTIYIKSDLEIKTNTRTHNYRVVMLKRDVELDMRGRCSAGQKVLASIIIRLALAECFSRDCGVIALDEPTTNLDEKNIESLALSLHRIIETRRHQKNFQLIIITHDEHFLELMNCADFTDHYWRVSRNEKDDSIIEKQSILAVMRK